MMLRLRALSGSDLIRMFARFGFLEISQRGRHVKLRRVFTNGVRENLTVPLHDELIGAPCRPSIAKHSRYISEAEARTSIRTEVRPPFVSPSHRSKSRFPNSQRPWYDRGRQAAWREWQYIARS